LVIASEVWRNRFASDPTIIGRVVQLGEASHSIVGVMPDGFAFPVNDRFWTPLRVNASVYEKRKGPSLAVFGRLAPAATFDSAQAELTMMGLRSAAAFPTTHDKLRPKVSPYTYPFFDMNDPSAIWVAHLMQFLISLLLVVVSVNVAILVYARTATRHGEIAVRTALGASRGRIVVQLFVEALVLAGAAALVAVGLTSFSLGLVNDAMRQVYPGGPFWWTFTVSPGLIFYVFGLAVLSAAIVGVLPALQATGRRVQNGLKQVSAGGGSGMQFGRTWTALIVLQVAIAVALLPAAVFHTWDSLRYGLADPGSAVKEFLTAQLTMDRTNAPAVASPAYEGEFASRYLARTSDVMQRLASEPGVTGLTFAASLPGSEPTVWIEADGIASPGEGTQGSGWVASGTRAGHQVRTNRVATSFFDTFGVPLLIGRRLNTGDAELQTPQQADVTAGEGTIVVNQTFVRDVLGGSNALGRRVRYVGISNDAEPGEVTLGRWYQIVGVVGDFPREPINSGLANAKLYHAAPSSGVYGASLAIRIKGSDPDAFAGRLREISATIDPNLQLRNVATLDAVLRQEQGMMRLVAAVLAVLTISVLLLAAAGIYALVSFTVAQRRKEIGIRAALGADPGQIFRGIFSRALWQMGAGAAIGVLVAALLEVATDGGLMSGHGTVVLPMVTGLVMTVGMLAVLAPARRGLRVHPTEALREQ
jgi:predicted permease